MSFWTRVAADTDTFLRHLTGDGAAAGATVAALAGALLAGMTCGTVGSFVILRRMALFGDMLGHAVLPGVAAGFVLVGRKSTPALLGGALVAGLLAAGLTRTIRSSTRLKEDACLGISLSLFYALGVWLLSWITRNPALSSEASGLKHYLFGNPAVILPADLWFLAGAAIVVLVLVVLFYKELLACTFDPGFAVALGIRSGLVDALLLGLLSLVIVVSIKILGVILVAALLVIPPAAAHLLSERLHRMVILSASLGAFAGLGGVYSSFVLHVGTGPSIVCTAFAVLVAAFLFSPRHGLLARWIRNRRLSIRATRESVLASAYRVLEQSGNGPAVRLEELAHERGEPMEATHALARMLRGAGWGAVRDGQLVLTPEGHHRARRVIRLHRLWELFLQREASLAPDHVHAGAEEVQHLLNEAAVEELEELLGHPEIDPHGKTIPSIAERLERTRGGDRTR